MSVAGSTNLDGITDWQVGDWAVFTEQGGVDAWEKIDNVGKLNYLSRQTNPRYKEIMKGN